MEREEFLYLRKKLNKTQREMAQLLGTSVKAIHSYEQGWRSIPVHAERQIFFLVARSKWDRKASKPCWITKGCPPERKRKCPAWEFQSGELCWFINGTICEGMVHENWKEKMKMCRSCEIFASLI